MTREERFSYACHACGRCCRDKVITLAPHDLLRLARAADVTTAEARRRFTVRRGSILKFGDDGACVVLDGTRCSLHSGRPLACRLYPLGIERNGRGEKLVRLEPANGTLGMYGNRGTVAEFLDEQGVAEYLAMNDSYRPLIAMMRERVEALVDFELIEPREFWRRAVRDALAESNVEPNALIDALFDPDGLGCARESIEAAVAAHVDALARMIRACDDAPALASAAVMLAVSIGYAPGEAVGDSRRESFA